MLTSGQCVLAAYMTDGGIICVECARKRNPEIDGDQLLADAEDAFYRKTSGRQPDWNERSEMRGTITESVRAAEEAAGLHPLIQYELDSDEGFAESGCYCDDCSKELVEPDPVEEEDVEMDAETEKLDDYLRRDEHDSEPGHINE